MVNVTSAADIYVASDTAAPPDSVRDRLIRTADVWLQRHGVDQLSIEVVAAAARVSRATAFRKLGGRDQLVVAVALARSDRFKLECATEMACHVGAFAKLEAAFLYLVRELPNDPIVRELFALKPAGDFGPEADAIANATLGPAIEAGRAAGEVRDDVSIDEIVHWTVEQLYLAVVQTDRSPAAVIKRVRTYLTPALSAHRAHQFSGSIRSRIESLDFALDRAREALSALQEAARSPDTS
ncbi:TetR/AcrR family transcriptional regulator [Mycobacterium sp.]|uniref:TetR/AcrR family transcriptional regulator n=1 Tax=Mycobacterium sp. TaxID=1785 RepID=UPI0025DE1449|nr:TetR/AcrR family transcriptional regulator [Mycobacterium sp.]